MQTEKMEQRTRKKKKTEGRGKGNEKIKYVTYRKKVCKIALKNIERRIQN